MKQQKLTGYQPNYPKRILKGTVLTAAVLVGLGSAIGCKEAFEPGPDIEGMISIATPEPEERPINRFIMSVVREPVAPTAATDWLPQKRPTTTKSAALKSNCSNPVSIMGIVYSITVLRIGPSVKEVESFFMTHLL